MLQVNSELEIWKEVMSVLFASASSSSYLDSSTSYAAISTKYRTTNEVIVGVQSTPPPPHKRTEDLLYTATGLQNGMNGRRLSKRLTA